MNSKKTMINQYGNTREFNRDNRLLSLEEIKLGLESHLMEVSNLPFREKIIMDQINKFYNRMATNYN
jgi:hypothetical protein